MITLVLSIVLRSSMYIKAVSLLIILYILTWYIMISVTLPYIRFIFSFVQLILIFLSVLILIRLIQIYSLKDAIKNFKEINQKPDSSINKALKIIHNYICLMCTLAGFIIFLFFNFLLDIPFSVLYYTREFSSFF